MKTLTSIAAILTLLAIVSQVSAQDFRSKRAAKRAAALAERPCGPADSKIKKFIPQGWRGAEFKPACRKHDACYVMPGTNRVVCDKQFQQDLLASCANSKRPRQCERVVNLMHKAVDRFGEESFEDAQLKAQGIAVE